MSLLRSLFAGSTPGVDVDGLGSFLRVAGYVYIDVGEDLPPGHPGGGAPVRWWVASPRRAVIAAGDAVWSALEPARTEDRMLLRACRRLVVVGRPRTDVSVAHDVTLGLRADRANANPRPPQVPTSAQAAPPLDRLVGRAVRLRVVTQEAGGTTTVNGPVASGEGLDGAPAPATGIVVAAGVLEAAVVVVLDDDTVAVVQRPAEITDGDAGVRVTGAFDRVVVDPGSPDARAAAVRPGALLLEPA